MENHVILLRLWPHRPEIAEQLASEGVCP